MQNGYDFLEVDRILAALRPNARLRIKPYAYPFNFGAAGAGATVTAARVIDSNCDFLWLATNIGPVDTIPSYGVQLQDSGTGEFYLPSSQPFTFLGGCMSFGDNSSDSIYLGFPRLIPANSNIVASITDLSGGGFAAGQMVMHGVRVYEYG